MLQKKPKHLLVETELKNLGRFDAAYFRGRNYFVGNDGTQNYLVFQPMYNYFKLGSFRDVSLWESKGLSNEKVSSYTTTSEFLRSPILHYDNARMKLKFEGYPLKQNIMKYGHGPIVNVYIVYRLSSTGIGG